MTSNRSFQAEHKEEKKEPSTQVTASSHNTTSNTPTWYSLFYNTSSLLFNSWRFYPSMPAVQLVTDPVLNPLTSLPNDVTENISFFIDRQEWGQLSQTCKGLNSLFQNALTLLHFVMIARQDQADKLLLKRQKSDKTYWRFILQKAPGREESRIWKSISPLEYAAWAGHTPMLNMLLTHLTCEEARTEALAQLMRVWTDGTEHGKHLSGITPLINAYEQYDEKFVTWNDDQRDTHWIKVIGMAQRQLPLNVFQVFCHHNYTDKFDTASERTCKTRSGRTLVMTDLGTIIALMLPFEWGPPLAVERCPRKDAFGDLQIIRNFHSARIENLLTQISQLQRSLKHETKRTLSRDRGLT